MTVNVKQILSDKQIKHFQESNKRWNVACGARSSGKTHGSFYKIPQRILKYGNYGNKLFVAKTYTLLERNIFNPMRELFGSDIVSPISNGVVHICGYPCYCIGANDETAKTKIQGTSFVYAYCDEFPLYPQSFFEMLKSGLRQKGACADLTANPENPNHWAKNFIDNTDNLLYTHFVLDDNPFLDQDYVKAIKQEYTGAWYQRMILGLWVAQEGAVYELLTQDKCFVDELPDMKFYVAGLDYGPASVTTAWLVGYGFDNKMYFVDRWRWDVFKKYRQLSDDEVATEIDNWLDALNINIQNFIIPQDAASLATYMNRSIKSFKRINRLGWADKSAGSVQRGIQAVNMLLNTDKLKFHKSLQDKGWMNEWQGYSWKPNQVEDVPLKQNDHDPDAGRYAIMHLAPYWQRNIK